MTERERLIKLLNDVSSAQYEGDILINSEMDIDTSEMNRIADYLLANGVIVPLGKVDDTVYKVIPRCTARKEGTEKALEEKNG